MKKTIKVKSKDGTGERIKTVYITDAKQIKQFKKRKSKKEVREAKRKGGPSKKKKCPSPSSQYSRRDDTSLVEHGGRMVIKFPNANEEENPLANEPVCAYLTLFIDDCKAGFGKYNVQQTRILARFFEAKERRKPKTPKQSRKAIQ